MSAWRWAFVIGLVALSLVLGVVSSKGSYANILFSGQCFAKPTPPICLHPPGRYGYLH